jgi:hypothetical protein
VKLFSSNNNFSNMEFLLPMVTKDRTGFIRRPMTNAAGLRWIRTALIRLGAPNAQVEKLTWPSFRVFFADWAFQAGISRDRRRYIGRWASEATADDYTREHRSVVCNIWKEVTPQTDKIRAGHSAPEDLSRKDYQLETRAGATGVPDPDAASKAPATAKDTIDLTKGAPGPVCLDPVPITPVIVLAADLVSEQTGGPLAVICATKKTGRPSTFKIHLLKTDGSCIGCAWKPRFEAYNNLNEQDFQTAGSQGMNPCKTCFKFYTYPTVWTTNLSHGAETSGSDGFISSGSATDSENDSASEAEALRPANPNMGKQEASSSTA